MLSKNHDIDIKEALPDVNERLPCFFPANSVSNEACFVYKQLDIKIGAKTNVMIWEFLVKNSMTTK